MIKVMNFELGKYFRSKTLPICLLVILIIPIFEFLFLYISSKMGSETLTLDFINMYINANGDQIFKYLYYVLFNGGSIFIVSAIMGSIVISEDYTHGTMKYMMVLTSRKRLAMGKVFSVITIGTLMNLAGVLVSIAIGLISRDNFFSKYTFNNITLYIIIGWLVVVAYILLVAVISSLVNNVPASIGIGSGVYLIVWAFGMYLPESVRDLIFIFGVLKIGNTDIANLFKVILVSIITIFILVIVLYKIIRNKEF